MLTGIDDFRICRNVPPVVISWNMADKRQGRAMMQVGDRILLTRGLKKEVFIVARIEVPHSTQRAFVSKSGAGYSIGLRVWKSDFIWNEKARMWVRKG